MALGLHEFRHPSWVTAMGTVAGYLLVLALLTIALFVVPWLVFSVL